MFVVKNLNLCHNTDHTSHRADVSVSDMHIGQLRHNPTSRFSEAAGGDIVILTNQCDAGTSSF